MTKSIPRWLLVSTLLLTCLSALNCSVFGEKHTPPRTVLLWSSQGPVAVERPSRIRATQLSPNDRLSTLLAGPTAEERARGLWSAIPEGTKLAQLQEQPDSVVIVRLEVSEAALQNLDHESFEIIVQQIGGTLQSLDWRELRIETRDPSSDAFVPLANFLPEIPTPRKEMPPEGEMPGITPSPPAGQPPASGQGQPAGGLSGKTVYVSAGHGWEWDYDGRCSCVRWKTQRPPYPYPPYEDPIIEDHNNAEAVNQYLLQYLWNAGARVIPTRERGMNENAVIVDDDDPAPNTSYSETGSWSNSSFPGTGYASADYRWTTTVTGEPTATAAWSAVLPADGRYAVYVWYRQGPNRIPDARYAVHHAGGTTEVVVNQRHHGSTWHYLGTFGFRADKEARITLTNQSNVADQAVIADAVRFGGGTFDALSGISTGADEPPDKPWWEVAAYYYTQRMGMDAAYGDVTARPTYARWEHANTGDDAVYVSWHTNGCTGYQWSSRGTLSIIHNGVGSPLTPGSEALRDVIHNEMIQDIRSAWDPTWPGYKRSMNLGELRALWDPDLGLDERQIPGALIEVAYHDHPDDTDALKEPTFNALAARAIYQGIVKYFEQRDGIDLTLLPEPPTHLRVRNVGEGQVRVSWQPSPTDALDLTGDAATGYRVYVSADGIGWSDGIPVAGANDHILTGFAPGQLILVRVTATNDGGESFPTETLAARVGDDIEMLLVNGFDRLNRSMAVPETDPVEGYNIRVLTDRMNRYDYAKQHAESICYPFDSTSNEAVQDGLVSLSDYGMLDWILGEESTSDETLDAVERTALEDFMEHDGGLLLSGTEIGWHLDQEGGAPEFYNTVLRADYVDDDADTYEITPVSGSIFDGLNHLRFDAPGMYDADYPDIIAPFNGSKAALTYQNGAGTAAIQYENGCERLIHFGFPFETIHPHERGPVMARILGFLDPRTITINTPFPTSPAFEGTARVTGETVTLDRVEVQIERGMDDRYWNGTDWTSESTWLTATGTSTWSYSLPSPLVESLYHLRARVWTAQCGADPFPAETTFIYDPTPAWVPLLLQDFSGQQ